MKSLMTAIWILALGVAAGCGDDVEEFTDLTPENLDAEPVDWVVDGFGCEGERVSRLVSVVEESDQQQRQTVYRRGDDCIERGAEFWDAIPEVEGEQVTVMVDSDEPSREFTVGRPDEHVLELTEDDGDMRLRMYRVYPQANPSPIRTLPQPDLSGRWWMEGYPCHEEMIVQLVEVLQPPGASVHLSKIIGDDCIGAGENFLDGQLDGTVVSGQAQLDEDDDEWSNIDPDDEHNWSEVSGTVHTEDFVRLDVAGQAVSLRRVLGDGDD